MIKLIDLLNEIDIPKNSWKPISSSELKDVEKDILDLIQNAYGPIGGHPNYKSVGDLAGSDYEVIDLDDDPEIDAVTVKDTISKALKGKEIEMQDNGSYTRYLGGKKYIKLMFGKPTI